MEMIETGNFCFPLDAEEAKQHINDRRETLIKIFTKGFSALKFMVECGMETYGEGTPLFLVPYKGTFEIAPVYKTGVHLPTCLPGINVLWARSSRKEFIRQATLLCNSWLVSYAAYISSRIEPYKDPPIWEAVMLGESINVTVLKYHDEVDEKEEELNAKKQPCDICRTWKKEHGVCCTVCRSWAHLTCAAMSVAEKLDAMRVGTSGEEDLTDPSTYSCSSCR